MIDFVDGHDQLLLKSLSRTIEEVEMSAKKKVVSTKAQPSVELSLEKEVNVIELVNAEKILVQKNAELLAEVNELKDRVKELNVDVEQHEVTIEDLMQTIDELRQKKSKAAKKYRLVTAKVDKKMPKQELALIINAPDDAEFTGVEMENAAKDAGELVTRQPEGKIFAWYRENLISGGYIQAA
jgi:uncharacterized coiled-coil DUF342 family protein